MKITDKEYQTLAKRRAPKSPILKDCLFAFLSGGLLCTLGQVVIFAAQSGGLDEKNARLCASLSLIVLSILLTGLNIYDNLAKHAGAGMIVPITGFANSMSSPSIEFKSEGWILGLGAKMFTIAGPVIVYGTVASVIYGVVYWITTLF